MLGVSIKFQFKSSYNTFELRVSEHKKIKFFIQSKLDFWGYKIHAKGCVFHLKIAAVLGVNRS